MAVTMDNAIEALSKNILTELCSTAPATDVRDCLRKFKGGINFTYKEQYNSLFPCQKPVVVNTLEFLGCHKDWKDFVKPQCVHELVCRLQNLLPDVCEFCDNLYSVSKDEHSLLSCAKCGQGAHTSCLLEKLGFTAADNLSADDVSALINPYSLTGLSYFCKLCKEDYIPSSEVGRKVASKKKRDTVIKPPAVSKVNSAVNEPLLQVSQGDLNNERSPENHNSQNENHTPQDGVSKDVICNFYAKGTCKYGISGKGCKFSHPRICKKYLNYGNRHEKGCKDKQCKFFHPKLCPLSFSKNGCDRSCTMVYHAKLVSKTKSFKSKQRPKKNITNDDSCPQQENQSSVLSNDFLEVLQSFKTEMLQQMELKMALLISQTSQTPLVCPEGMGSRPQQFQGCQMHQEGVGVNTNPQYQSQYNQMYPAPPWQINQTMGYQTTN